MPLTTEDSKDVLFHLALAAQLGLPIHTRGVGYFDEGAPTFPVAVEVCVERITFARKPETGGLLRRRLRELEQEGLRTVLITDASAVTPYFSWGWTIAVRGNTVVTIQRVLFPRRLDDDLIGEADQGTIYRVRAEHVSAWDGYASFTARAAA